MYARGEGVTICFFKVLFIVNCDFDGGSLKINIFKVLFFLKVKNIKVCFYIAHVSNALKVLYPSPLADHANFFYLPLLSLAGNTSFLW